MKFRIRTLAAATAAITATATPLAHAQSEGGIEEIVVTAQFREGNLQETPIAITAMTDEMMRVRGQTSIAQVSQQAPNVQIKQNSGPFGAATSAFIRGVGQGDFNFALEPGVGMYIDDVYYPTMTGSNFEIVDLERVEILRGPQGTLQGRNSIGGAVRLINRKPTGDGPAYVELTAGRFARISGRAATDLTLADNLFLRISGASTAKDGYVDRLDFACAQPAVAASLGIQSQNLGKSGCKLGTLGGRSSVAGRAQLRWLPSDDLEINFAADLTNDDSEATAMVLVNAPAGTGVGPLYGPWFNTPHGEYFTYETFSDPTSTITAPFSTPPINELVSRGASMTIDYGINDALAFKSVTSWRELTNDWATAHDGSPLNGETGWNELDGDSLQQEFRLNGDLENLAYTLGAFYFTQENTNRNRIDLGYLGFPFDFISEEVADSTSKALFAHAVWSVTDAINLTTGVRWSDEEKSQLLGRLNSATGGVGASPFFAALIPTGGYPPVVTFSDDRLDYRVSLDYRFNDDLMAYATYSTGYKSGGVSPRFFFVSHIQPFGVEELEAYELGVKADLLDNTLRINAATFFNDYTDQQSGAPGSICPELTPPAPCLTTGNFVDSEYWGWELEANWLPFENTIVDFSVSEINADYTRISPLTLANPNFVANPDGPPGIPQYKGSLGIQHSIVMGSRGTFTPRLDINSESARVSAVTNLRNVPSFTVANVRLGWLSEDATWEVAGTISNVSDKYYFHNIFDISAFGGWVAGQPAEPREWNISVRRTF